LAGSLGAALLQQYFAHGWAKRLAGSRVVEFSAQGEAQFRASLLRMAEFQSALT
jgi:hypothetical protein